MIDDVSNTSAGNRGVLEERHLGERLSGYLDGELTQQDRHLVERHCEACAQCRADLEELKSLRERIAGVPLSPIGPDEWRENMNDSQVNLSRGLGWIAFILGSVFIGLWLVIAILFDDGIDPMMKVLIFAVYGGLAALLYSVLRQRLIERKTDKYKDVEI